MGIDYQVLNDIRFRNYRNSTEVINVGGVGLTVEDVLKAALISRLNIYLIGETGGGKTQIENDILALFGNNGFFEQGRNDLEIRDMFTRLNLEKIRSGEAKSTEEIKELTAKIHHPVFIVDELTRCIPAVQNQFFNLFDGFITIDGVKYPLGSQDYSIGIASGNAGNGRYVGVSETDRALLDRMHLILDLDNFDTAVGDDLEILASKSDPRVSETLSDDQTDKIIMLREEVSKRKITQISYIAALYLRKGLDYLEDVPGNSKRKVKNAWPQVVKDHGKGSDEALVFPISMRAAITYLVLSNALEMVAEAKGGRPTDHLNIFLNTFALAGAYSGILNPMAVEQNYNENPYDAMKAVVSGISTEFERKKEHIALGIGAARQGVLEGKILEEFKGRWGFMRSLLEKIAEDARRQKAAQAKNGG